MFNSQKRETKSAVSKQIAKKKKIDKPPDETIVDINSITDEIRKQVLQWTKKSNLCLKINTSQLL